MLDRYWNIFFNSFSGYWNYLINEILHPNWHNYFYWLIGLSVLVYALEIILPWRKNQAKIRKDFWLDAFYMFFNFFLFSLIIYNGVSNVAVELFSDFLGLFGIENWVAIQLGNLPVWSQLLIMFVVADFIQWNVHKQLHARSWLWKFHQLHHSVKEMGFAAHLRFHWMETVVYKSVLYVPLGMLGFGIDDFFVVHIVAVLIGHLNHANVDFNYGVLKYLFNNPKMHIWHHAKELPKGREKGVNFGISLSIWDYLFGTNYIPADGKDIELGFEGDDQFPENFVDQMKIPKG